MNRQTEKTEMTDTNSFAITPKTTLKNQYIQHSAQDSTSYPFVIHRNVDTINSQNSKPTIPQVLPAFPLSKTKVE